MFFHQSLCWVSILMLGSKIFSLSAAKNSTTTVPLAISAAKNATVALAAVTISPSAAITTASPAASVVLGLVATVSAAAAAAALQSLL